MKSDIAYHALLRHQYEKKKQNKTRARNHVSVCA